MSMNSTPVSVYGIPGEQGVYRGVGRSPSPVQYPTPGGWIRIQVMEVLVPRV